MADSAKTDTWDGGGFEGRGGGGLTVVSSFKISLISCSSSFTSILGSSIISAVAATFVSSTFSSSTTISIGFVSSTTIGTIISAGVLISSGFNSSTSIIGAAAITDATIVSSVTVSTIIGAAGVAIAGAVSVAGAGVHSISTFGCSDSFTAASTDFGNSVRISATAFGAVSSEFVVFSSVVAGVSVVGVVTSVAAAAASVSSFCGCLGREIKEISKKKFKFCVLYYKQRMQDGFAVERNQKSLG